MGRGTGINGTAVAGLRARVPTAGELPGDAAFRRFCDQHLNYTVLSSTADVNDLVSRLLAGGIRRISLDFETARGSWDEWGPQHGSIRLVQIGVKGEQTGRRRQWLIDCHSANPDAVAQLFKDRNITKEVFFSEFEQEWAIAHLGVPITNISDPCFNEQSIQVKLAKTADIAALSALRRRFRIPENANANTREKMIAWCEQHHGADRGTLDAAYEQAMREHGIPAAQQALKDAAEQAGVTIDHEAWAGKQRANMRELAERYLGLTVPKDEQGSDWGRPDLTESQLRYAAGDVAIMPDLCEKTEALARALGVSGKVRYRIRKTIERAREREQELAGVKPMYGEPHPRIQDHADEIAWAMMYAESKEELDMLWARAHRDGVTRRNRQILHEFYRQRSQEIEQDRPTVTSTRRSRRNEAFRRRLTRARSPEHAAALQRAFRRRFGASPQASSR